MSIKIIPEKCVGCNKCIDICPGNLISKDENNKAYMKYPKDCWGCTACLKQCGTGAILYYLGEDIGGCGGSLYVKKRGKILNWHITDKNNEEVVIVTSQEEANNY